MRKRNIQKIVRFSRDEAQDLQRDLSVYFFEDMSRGKSRMKDFMM